MRQILVGQFISALIAGTGVFSSLLAAEDLNFPIFLCFLNYVLLSLFVFRRGVVSRLCPSCYSSPVVTGGRGKRSVFEMLTRSVDDDDDDGGDNNVVDDEVGTDALPPAHVAEQRVATVDRCARLSKLLCCRYVLAALVDVYANFLIILAYQYTTITSIMLLDCFTIPVAMLLSRLFLKCRYTRRHLLGVCLCLGGLVLIVISDAVNGDRHAGPNPLLGDILCLTGAALYGASNVLQEFLVKFSDRDDFMGWMGCCGAAISLVQLLSTDLPKLRRATYTTTGYLYTGGFVTCLFLMYTNTSAFLQNADSTLFNLSLLTSDVYAVLFSYLRYGHFVSVLYFGAFFLVAAGLLVYHSSTPPVPAGGPWRGRSLAGQDVAAPAVVVDTATKAGVSGDSAGHPSASSDGCDDDGDGGDVQKTAFTRATYNPLSSSESN